MITDLDFEGLIDSDLKVIDVAFWDDVRRDHSLVRKQNLNGLTILADMSGDALTKLCRTMNLFRGVDGRTYLLLALVV